MHWTMPSTSSSLTFSSLSCHRPSLSLLVLFVCILSVVFTAQAASVGGSAAPSSSPLLEILQRFKRTEPEDGSVNKYVNSNNTQDKNASVQVHHRRRHRHMTGEKQSSENNSTSSLLDKLRSNTKRCRYSSADQEELENYAKRNQVKTSTTYEESFNYYGNHHLDYEAEHRYRNYSGYRSGSGGFIKQPRIREQSFGRGHGHHGHGHGHHHHQGLLDPSVEIEKLFVDIGELVNLTCNINAKEIDWHFKDKNLTTTIISNGPYLQVEQSHIPAENEVLLLDGGASPLTRRNSLSAALKYRLSSDRHSSHMLTLYVQGSQDEGSYQCIDSKSETPIKKTIRLILSKPPTSDLIEPPFNPFNFNMTSSLRSLLNPFLRLILENNSRALTSGMASHSASLWLLALALIAINRQIQ